jgi:hypothetical protein
VDWRRWWDRLSGNGLHSRLTRGRIVAAYGVAIATDALQVVLGPFGWAGADEILDGIAMVASTALLGFHPLLLPTFVLELVPLADLLPSWTVSVALVIAARRTALSAGSDAGPAIDIKPTSVR